ncbi:MAG: hydrogenase expression/formation protein HypE [Deltaproteobacteria bacterium]|nr:hydrogenase expression/formation protein HypE [Deltaproteobacteria bacterium]
MITLGHGAGGRLSQKLVAEHFLPKLDNPALAELGDSAVLEDIALTTDCYVVTPRFFPGGDLGRLAICGTVNDLAMVGAEPLGLTAGFIFEEGFPLEELDRLVDSAAGAAKEAGVQIVAGDTKVVPRGACDGVFVTTSGAGRVDSAFRPAAKRASAGDTVIISGTLGDHGMAVMACREGLPIEGNLQSDVAPLIGMVRDLKAAQIEVHTLRDPTRGGVAQSLIEIANASGVRIVIDEKQLPIRPTVLAACELLGIDPLYVANEGKLLALVPRNQADKTLEVLNSNEWGKDARVIGQVVDGNPGLEITTPIGARRAVRMPSGEILPRIC